LGDSATTAPGSAGDRWRDVEPSDTKRCLTAVNALSTRDEDAPSGWSMTPLRMQYTARTRKILPKERLMATESRGDRQRDVEPPDTERCGPTGAASDRWVINTSSDKNLALANRPTARTRYTLPPCRTLRCV